MIIPIRIKDKCGYPVFEVVRDKIKQEPIDGVRLCNYGKDLVVKFEYAFTCHSNATDMARKRKPTKGISFSDLVTKMIRGKPPKEAKELAKLKEVVRKVIPLLKDTPYVDELTKLVEEKKDATPAQDFSAS